MQKKKKSHGGFQTKSHIVNSMIQCIIFYNFRGGV